MTSTHNRTMTIKRRIGLALLTSAAAGLIGLPAGTAAADPITPPAPKPGPLHNQFQTHVPGGFVEPGGQQFGGCEQWNPADDTSCRVNPNRGPGGPNGPGGGPH